MTAVVTAFVLSLAQNERERKREEVTPRGENYELKKKGFERKEIWLSPPFFPLSFSQPRRSRIKKSNQC